MTEDEFLNDPVDYFWGANDEIPIEWISKAWRENTRRFRSIVTAEMSRTVSKMGVLFYASCNRVLATALTDAEVVELYERIRDDSMRLEWEWRLSFQSAFPKQANLLPPIQDLGFDNQ